MDLARLSAYAGICAVLLFRISEGRMRSGQPAGRRRYCLGSSRFLFLGRDVGFEGVYVVCHQEIGRAYKFMGRECDHQLA